MKLRTLCGAVAVSLAMLAVLTSPDRSADAQEPSTITARSESVATDIVTGTVLSTTSVEFPSGIPHWITEVEISSTRKGDGSGTILVEVEGGYTSDGDYLLVPDNPVFQADDIVELALIAAPADDQVLMFAALSESSATAAFSIVGGNEGTSVLSPATESAARGDFRLILNPNGDPAQWPAWALPIPYKVRAGATPAEVATIRAAFQTWEDEPGSNIRFRFDGLTQDGLANDGVNVVSFATYDDPRIALTQLWFRSSGVIGEFDIMFKNNSGFGWSTNPGGELGKWHLESIALREIGNAIGIDETFEIPADWVPPGTETSRNEVMHPAARGNNYSVRNLGPLTELGPGDTQAVRALYWQRRECSGRSITVDIGLNQSPTNGDDVILGTGNDDVIDGLRGNDIICGAKGDDELSGDGGNDELRGQDGDDVLFGGEGNDLIVGGNGKDRGRGQNGNDELLGGPGNDNLNGNNGDDRVLGQGGNDYVSGRDGEDTVSGGNGNDTVNGGGKSDRLLGGNGDDVMNGNAFADIMSGGDGNDIMSGGDGPDQVNGDGGNDRLDGNRGNDALVGGSGTDICEGRTGFDTAFGCETERNIP